ncbi:hypothetical protein V6C27_09080 [Peptococcaceae bacterium 1198_IL3148]
MFFKRTLVFVLVLVVLGGTGCVNCTINIKEHHDQSADIQYQVSISALATRLISDQGANPIEDLKQLALLNGFSVKDLVTDNAVGYTAERHVDSVTQIPDLTSVLGLGRTGNNAPIQINKGLFYHWLQLDTNIDLSNIYGQRGSEEEKLARILIKDANLKLMYTTSKPMVKHNATHVLPGNGEDKTYVWDIHLGEQNKITLTTKHLQTGSIAAVATLGVIIGYCILMYIYLAKKEKEQQPAAQIDQENAYLNSTDM